MAIATQHLRHCINDPRWFLRVISDLTPVRPFWQANVALTRSADVLVTVHGAGAANAHFMRPGSSLLELRPYELGRYHRPWPDRYFRLTLDDSGDQVRGLAHVQPFEWGLSFPPVFNSKNVDVCASSLLKLPATSCPQRSTISVGPHPHRCSGLGTEHQRPRNNSSVAVHTQQDPLCDHDVRCSGGV